MKLSKGFIILQCFLALAGRSIATDTSKIREDNQRKVVNLSREVEIPESIALSSPIMDFTRNFQIKENCSKANALCTLKYRMLCSCISNDRVNGGSLDGLALNFVLTKK